MRNNRLPPEDRIPPEEKLSPKAQKNKLRFELIEVTKNNDLRLEQIAEVFAELSSSIREYLELLEIAKSAKLKLSDFRISEHLGLYFNISHGRQPLGYISKGWSDPGFRLGEIISIPASKLPLLRENTRKISKLCATNGLVVTVNENETPIAVYLEYVIYQEGFNRKTLMKALETLSECVEQVREMLA